MRAIRPKVVLCSIGSLGDLYPFMAVAEALSARGASTLIATTPDHAALVRDAGLSAAAVYPELGDMLGLRRLSVEQTWQRIHDDSLFVFEFIMAHTMEAVRAMFEHVADASVVVGYNLAAAGEVTAARCDVPFVPVVLHPMTMMSAYDPPTLVGRSAFFNQPRGGPKLWWNKQVVSFALKMMTKRLGPQLNAVRTAAGLGPLQNAPGLRFEAGHPLTLAMYSPLLGALQPDAPPKTVQTGTPFYLPPQDRVPLAPELLAFLDSGPRPLVFTLGSAAVMRPGRFFDEAVTLARTLGRRALLVGAPRDATAEDVFATPYAAHRPVFERAAAVVHQGGVGTLGHALAAGRPQLVVPHGFDQFDNAARAKRLGVAEVIHAEVFTAEHALPTLSKLLSDQTTAARAQAIAKTVKAEKGAEVAADAIMAVASNQPARTRATLEFKNTRPDIAALRPRSTDAS